MKFNLGEPTLQVDLSTLIDSRLLIQANSGGGKSWCIRRILEQTHGKVQQLVLDPEGEFGTLREKYDYVYAAKQGGDTATHPRSAKLLAERLLELGVSAILDIYELKPHERVAFVRLFLEALIDAPKSLWHPVLVVVDEAHVYCPQKGEAESAGAVNDLCTRGRKRGFCAVLATQRLSKLHKDAAAELNNKLIGRTGLDVDMARAAEELGFNDREQRLSLRSLPKGHFYAFGPAISDAVVRVHVGDVVSHHPEAGSRIAFTPAPPTDAVKALLPKLSDLPKEAEDRQRTVDELKQDNATLRRQLTMAQRGGDAAPVNSAELRQAQASVATLNQALERLMKFILEITAQDFFKAGGEQIDQEKIQKVIDAAAQQAVKLVEANVKEQGKELAKWRRKGEDLLAEIGRLLKREVKVVVAVKHNEPFTVSPLPSRPKHSVEGNGNLTGPERRILNAIAWLEAIGVAEPEQPAVAFLAGYSYGGGAFNNPKGRLRSQGLVEYRGDRIRLTESGRGLADVPDAALTPDELQRRVLDRLPRPEQRILRPLLEEYPKSLSKEELAERADYAPGAGAFNNPLGRLRSLGLIDYPEPGRAVALGLLFLEGAA